MKCVKVHFIRVIASQRQKNGPDNEDEVYNSEEGN